MIGTLISVILLLIVLGVILWAVEQLLPMVPMPEPFARIIRVLIIVIVVLVVVYIIAGLLGAVAPLRF
jgi:preprotein translocase subunit SecE